MLLTSGQISMTISSCIVFIFTSLLFLSGYVLQQQTVRGLQEALRPPPPPTPTLSTSPPPPSSAIPKEFGNPPGSRGHVAFEEYISIRRPEGGWGKVAYVQLLRNHIHVCNAVMLFADLSRERSPAQRIILYPSVWNEQRESQKAMTPYLETSMRLLQRAAKRYGVQLLPVKPILGLGVGSVMAYPLAGLLSLTTFDRLMYLRPAGLMLNSSPLDDLFTTPMNTSLATLSAGSADLPVTPAIVLLRPSMERYRDFATSLSAGGYSEEAFLQNSARILEQSPAPGRETVRLLAETSALELEGDDFNMTSFFAGTSYVHVQDTGMPGPEYDAPRDAFLRARPSGFHARGAWEDIYETYRTKRIDICGLDLEPVGLEGGGDDDGASGLPAFVEETV